MSHTPTPWKLGETCVYALDESGKTNRFYLNVQGGYSQWTEKTKTPSEEILANAEFIVRAVNAHDDLVNALKQVRPYSRHIPARVLDWINSALLKAEVGLR